MTELVRSRPGVYERCLAARDHPPGRYGGGHLYETYPGHHLQVVTGLEGAGMHPILRYPVRSRARLAGSEAVACPHVAEAIQSSL